MAWFLGPLLPQFEDWVVRMVLVLLIFASWAIVNYAMNRIRHQRDAALTEGVLATPSAGGASAPEEMSVLQSKLGEALHSLQGAGHGRRFLNEQPWYAIIGPPGAGKTTALLNAGLRFPLSPGMGGGALQGVGGTRNCEWWFTEQAVLIDTAGRYTTQDSHPTTDRAEWYAFLDLLRDTRPKQPLNGVIVAIAVDDIFAPSSDANLTHARAIRERVNELQTRLGVKIPSYLVFTKADLVAGFSEFFGDLDSVERSQVWGMTCDFDADTDRYVDVFAEQFRGLVGRLETVLFMRLRTERRLDGRTLVATFPSQMSRLELPLAAFLQALLSETPGEPAPFLRGVYFTSATQEGTPIDRLTGSIARTFGLELRRSPILRAEAGQSFFLTRLLQEVIFGEAKLISTPPSAARRNELVRAAVLATASLGVIAIVGVLWHLWAAGLDTINASMTAVQAYEHAAAALPLDRVSSADLRPIAPLLERARAIMPTGEDEQASTGLGLSQGPKLSAATTVLYRHAVERILLPRLLLRLEAQMRENMGRPDFLYETTRIYLMLGGAGPLDPGLVHEWMKLDWQAVYSDEPAARFRDPLLRHLDALLAEPLPPATLDGDLVGRARETFAKVSPAQRAYSRIRLSPAAQRVPPWRPVEALGAAGAPLFGRASGKPLTDGIPGLYTVDGFHTVLLPSLAQAARAIALESWVAGQRTKIDAGAAYLGRLQRDIIVLYQNDYAQAWDAMLADLNVIPPSSVSQAAQDLYILASPQSPMRNLLASAARQLTLSVAMSSAGARPGARELPVTDVDGLDARLRPLIGDTSPAKPLGLSLGQEIDERYAALRELVGNGPGAHIDQVLRSLNDMQQQFAKAAAASAGIGVLSGLNDPSPALRAEALRQPEPLARWLTALAASGAALRGGSSRP